MKTLNPWAKSPLLFVLLAVASQTSYAESTRIVHVTGQTAPDGGGTFGSSSTSFDVNDRGQVLFRSWVSAGYLGLFLSDSRTGNVEQVHSSDIPVPGAEEGFSLTDFRALSLNNRGQMAFVGIVEAGSGFNRQRRSLGYFSGGIQEDFAPVLQDGDVSTGGVGNLKIRFSLFPDFDMTETGQIYFSGVLEHPHPAPFSGTDRDVTFLRYDAANDELATILQDGHSGPNGLHYLILSSFLHSNVNDAGQVAFFSFDSFVFSNSIRGIHLTAETPADVKTIVSSTDLAPDGNGNFGNLLPSIQLNDSGLVSFGSRLDDTSRGELDDFGVFLGDGSPGSLVKIIREGDLTPGGQGRFSSIERYELSESGKVAVAADFVDIATQQQIGSGLFVSDGTTDGLSEVIRVSDLDIGSTGISLGGINDSGQIAFAATVPDSSDTRFRDIQGIYLYDEVRGVLPVVRTGDPLYGSTIGKIYAYEFNNAGQVVFHFSLASRQSGLAIWSIPEPPSCAMLVLSGAMLVTWRARAMLRAA